MTETLGERASQPRPLKGDTDARSRGRAKVALRDNLRAELKIIESRTLANGVVVASYEPIRP